MICPSCKQAVAAGANHCIHCGQTMPISGSSVPRGEEIQSYLVPAILVTIFCCFPLGIVSIVFAARVGGRLDEGDYAGARDASRRARSWCIVTLVSGIVVYFLGFVWVFVMLFSAGSMGH